jgi:hypothetical protein
MTYDASSRRARALRAARDDRVDDSLSVDSKGRAMSLAQAR